MAKQLSALAVPLPQSKKLHEITGTQLNKAPIITSSLSPIYNNPISINIRDMNDVLLQEYRWLTTISVASLPSVSYNNLDIRSSCYCLCFSCLSLLPLFRSHLSSLRLLVMSHYHTTQHEQLGPTVPQDSIKTVRIFFLSNFPSLVYFQ